MRWFQRAEIVGTLAFASLTYSFLETTRADPEPTASDHSPEKRIADGKDPWWRLETYYSRRR